MKRYVPGVGDGEDGLKRFLVLVMVEATMRLRRTLRSSRGT